MEDDFLNNELIERFEQMLESREDRYFDFEELIEIIEFYIEVNDIDYTNHALEYAEKIYVDNLDIKIKRIEYCLLISDLKQASKLIRDIKDIASSEIDYILVQARFWAQKNLPRKAISFYEKALEIDDEETDFIYNLIGNEYLNLDEIHSAIFAFKKALRFNPENDYSFYSVVQCYKEIHDDIECILFLNDYIETSPYSEAAWLQLGLLYNHQKKYNEAVDAFEYAIAINPLSIIAYINKAFSLEELGQLSAAINTLKETLKFDHSPAFTFLRIGEILEKQNKLQKALKYYHQAIKEDPQLDKAWSATAALYDKLSNHEEAEYYINQALKLDNENADYHSNAIYYYLKQMKFEEALKSLEKHLELKPLVFGTWYTYIEILMTIGEYTQAINVLLEGALKNFNRAEFYYQLSNAYYLTNQDKLGDDSLANALKLNQSIKNTMLDNYPVLGEKIIYLNRN